MTVSRLKPPFYLVDVFAEAPLSGNQLAVFVVPPDFPVEAMQRMAREINISETTFITSRPDRVHPEDGWAVRIFTPEEELPFAGHPTLGSAWIIRKEILREPAAQIMIKLACGQIPVTFQKSAEGDEILWMHQLPPRFGKTLEAGLACFALGIKTSELDTGFPIQEVTTGLPFVIIPLKSLSVLSRLKVQENALNRLLMGLEARAILAFCPETRCSLNQLSVRVFTAYACAPEDPATGSANGCLAGYLLEHRYFRQDQLKVRIEQGHELNRPSLLYLEAEKNGPDFHIRVGGKVFPVAAGRWQAIR